MARDRFENIADFSGAALEMMAEAGKRAKAELDRRAESRRLSDKLTAVCEQKSAFFDKGWLEPLVPDWVTEDDRTPEEKMDDRRDDLLRGIFG